MTVKNSVAAHQPNDGPPDQTQAAPDPGPFVDVVTSAATGGEAHIAALQLVGLDSSRRIADARAPFLAVLNALQHVPITTHLTVLLRWLGQPADRFSAWLMVASPESRPDQLESVARAMAGLFSAPSSPWLLEHARLADIELPDDGDVRFLRQSSMDVEVDGTSWRVPIRFANPGPGSWDRLIASMRAIPCPVDLAVTVTPTALTPAEEERLDELALLEQQEGAGLEHQRLRATAADAVASLRTAVFELQVAVIGQGPLDDVHLASIGGALSAPFHTAVGDGYQVAAPHRRVMGGFVIDPARRPRAVLGALAAGCPWSPTEGRDLRDLVTADETSFLVGWPVGSDGELPGVHRGRPLDLVPQTADSVRVGSLRSGEEVHLAFRDRTQHVALFGANGTGKTALLFNLLRQDIRHGRTIWVIDEPADLLTLLAHEVPESEHRRVVVLDCGGRSPHSINLMHLADGLTANLDFAAAVHDGLIGDLPTDFHGPVGRDSLLAVMFAYAALGRPLDDLLRVYEDRSTAKRLADDVAAVVANGSTDRRLRRVPEPLRQLHTGNESERITTLRWLRSKVPVLSDVASVLGSATPSHGIDDLVAPGAIVLVRPPHDVDGSRLVSSILLQVLARATVGRTVADHELVISVDEVQRCAGSALRQVMNESRKRGVAVHLATQHLRNVDAEAESILGNAATVLTGRLRGRSAATLAVELQLEPGQIQGLRNGQFVGSVLQAGQPVGPLLVEAPDRPTSRAHWPAWLHGGAG